MVLGGRLGKKCLPIDSGLLWGNVDIYRRLLVKENPGAYNIKFWAPGIFVSLYCQHYNDSLAPTPKGHIWKFSLIMPKYCCPTILFIYEFHNKISFWGHSKAIGFWPYVLAFKAAGPKILWYTELNFLVPKAFYIYQLHVPTEFLSRSTNAFCSAPTLMWCISCAWK